MEKYRQNMKKRAILLIAGVVVLTIIFGASHFLSNRYFNALNFQKEFFEGAQAGFFMGLETILIFFTVKTLVALSSDEKLKKQYIRENDERFALIKQKSGHVSYFIILAGLALAIVISSFFNETVFFTLVGVLFFVEFVRIGLKIFYKWRLG